MPDVTGDRLRDAQRKLQQEGITDVSAPARDDDDEDEDGRVLDQSPASGTKVAPGDRVVLIVGQLSAAAAAAPARARAAARAAGTEHEPVASGG